MKLLHFADAHIDMANYGRHDAKSGLPMRVLDFLKSLDTIVDAAVSEAVDLVIFAGDAYRDRSPAPTFQREWGKRIMRLSKAGIPTLLLVGNHDLSPAQGRANAIQEFDTLEIPNVRVISQPTFLHPADLDLPIQILAIPWVSRSGLVAATGMNMDKEETLAGLEERLTSLVQLWLDEVDPSLPVILTAHCSVEGAKYGSERTVMLGSDLTLSGSLVRDPRLDYVALGHIHKPQDLNDGAHPPVVYPGSIERVDFGEAEDDRYYVIADISRGSTHVDWRKLEGVRPFLDRRIELTSPQNVIDTLRSALPSIKEMKEAIVRLTVSYPREWEPLIDEAALRSHTQGTFEFHLVRRPQSETRIRLPGDQIVSSLSPLELLDQYWRASHGDEDKKEMEALQKMATELMAEEEKE